MKGALKLFTLFNIPVFVHWTFALMGVYVFMQAQEFSYNGVETAWSAATILLLFLCVVLHEYGHAMAARSYGIGTKNIVLYPIGGIALLNSIPEKPVRELWVAIAGPLVNVAIVLLLSPWLYWYGLEGVTERASLHLTTHPSISGIIPTLLLMNGVLFIFNLIPAFPMDGGRVLRALLSMQFTRVKATLWAARVGQFFALSFSVFGFMNGGIFMGFIGIFIFMMAQREYQYVKMESQLKEMSISDVIRYDFTTFGKDDPMYLVVHQYRQGREKNFLVTDEQERVLGVLHSLFVQEAMNTQQTDQPVATFMSPKFVPLSLDGSLKQLIEQMRLHGYSILPVYDGDKLIGVADVDHINAVLKSRFQPASRSTPFWKRNKNQPVQAER